MHITLSSQTSHKPPVAPLCYFDTPHNTFHCIISLCLTVFQTPFSRNNHSIPLAQTLSSLHIRPGSGPKQVYIRVFGLGDVDLVPAPTSINIRHILAVQSVQVTASLVGQYAFSHYKTVQTCAWTLRGYFSASRGQRRLHTRCAERKAKTLPDPTRPPYNRPTSAFFRRTVCRKERHENAPAGWAFTHNLRSCRFPRISVRRNRSPLRLPVPEAGPKDFFPAPFEPEW
jgi:hypothetical protein